MKQEELDLDFLLENFEEIGKNISYFLGIFEKEDMLSLIDEKIKDLIIDKSIVFAISIKYDDYNVNSFEECFDSQEIKDRQNYIIPLGFRNAIKDKINFTIFNYCQNEKMKIFEINYSNNHGRLKLLEDSIIYQIKLLYKNYQINKKEFSNFPAGLSLAPFEDEVDLKLDTIIHNSIKYILCYENSDRDKEMCKKLTFESYQYNNIFEYRLRKHVKENIVKYVNNFLSVYLKGETDDDRMSFSESKNTLLRTINLAKSYIYEIYSNDVYFQNKQCALIYQTYVKLFDNAERKMSKSATFKSLKIMIKKANMNYIMMQNEGYVYPFIFDLLVISFSLSLKTVVYKKELNNSKSMAKTINFFNTLNIDKDIDENYSHKEFLRLVELLPEDFNDYDVLIIKHYSEILNVDYNNIASVLRQLRFPVPDHNKGAYKIPKYLKNKLLSIDEDYFRCLSLNII